MYGRKEEMCYLMKLYNSETLSFQCYLIVEVLVNQPFFKNLVIQKTASFLRLFPELLFK